MAGKFEGKMNIAVGATKQQLGKITGNKKLQREGQFQKLKGTTQDATEGAKVAVKGTGKTLEREFTKSLQKLKSRIKP